MNIFIIHGAYGDHNDNWIPWLKEKLEGLKHTVITPDFPTPENQNLGNWLRAFSEYKDNIETNSIFIGHSLGAPFILNLLERINTPVKAVFFAAGFAKKLDHEIDKINATFYTEHNYEQLKKQCKSFYMLNGDDDPYVPIKVAEDLAKNLGIKINMIKGGGHLNKSSGYTEFEELWNLVKTELI